MTILHAIILSMIEGVTEFLPVSSTGHLILASDILRIPQTEFLKSFEVIIQSGAILAIVLIYIKILLTKRAILTRLLAAFVPTGIIGLVLYKFIKDYLLGNTVVVLWSLFIGGVILIVWEKYYQIMLRNICHSERSVSVAEESHATKPLSGMRSLRSSADSVGMTVSELSYKKAFIIGFFQSLSIIPGVSRAGATIVGAMTVGLNRKSAVEFSFLLAVPTMMAATGLDLVRSNFHFSNAEWGILAVGFAGAFVIALIAVKFFLRFVENHTFVPFGIYRIVLALLFWVLVIK